MKSKPETSAIATGLFIAVLLWGGNNTGTKYLVQSWPPIFFGCTRFIAAGIIFASLLRWTNLFGETHAISRDLNRRLWLRCGLTLALFIIFFNWAMKLTAASHVVLYLGASPVWALLWEGRPEKSWKSFQRYGAAALALLGVLILFWPMLIDSSKATGFMGEVLGLTASVIWTLHGRQCRAVGTELSGAEISSHSFWRAGVILLPLAVIESWNQTIPCNSKLILVQTMCILGGSIGAFALWNNGLRHWKTSKVYLFNNLIPLSTMTWAHFCLGEEITRTFWLAMLLIASGVLLGQTNWQKILGSRWLPEE